MQINGLSAGYSNPISLTGQGEPVKEGDEAKEMSMLAALLQPGGLGGGGATSSFREILAQYDVRDITPNDFSKMTQELHDAGEISDADLKVLNQVRQEMDASNIDPDESMDLLEHFRQKLDEQMANFRKLQAEAAESGITDINGSEFLAPTQNLLDWLEKFETVQSSGSSEAFDLLA